MNLPSSTHPMATIGPATLSYAARTGGRSARDAVLDSS
jgi:hypothetical protein